MEERSSHLLGYEGTSGRPLRVSAGMKLRLCVAGLFATLLMPTAAWADGLPVLNVDVGSSGVTAAGLNARYVTIPGGRNTLVAMIATSGGKVVRSRLLRGRVTVPAVAYDGSAGGLSADGGTLVLITPRQGFPRAKTTFKLLEAPLLRPRKTLTLRGDFSFDALSPDGRWIYLIEYTSQVDPLRYRVRVLDAMTGRLQPEPIVDPRNPAEKMNGDPLTRTSSPDGRWAYTLYSGTEHPFVHALDTVGRDARCVDLDSLAGRKDLPSLRLSLGSGELSVRDPEGKAIAVVDTLTFEPATPGSAGHRWTIPAVVLAGVVLCFSALRVRSRRAWAARLPRMRPR